MTSLDMNKDNLKNTSLVKSLDERFNKCNASIKGMQEMLDENVALEYLYKYTKDSYLVDYYKTQLEFDYSKDYMDEWSNEIVDNTKDMVYVNKIVDILVNNENEWYIDDDTIYMYDDDLLKEYNKNYDLLYPEE